MRTMIERLKTVAAKQEGPANSKGALVKAQDLKFPEGYCIDYTQMQIMKKCFEITAQEDRAEAIWDLMYESFNLGYLKGGRAALRGKFKEPARKRKQKAAGR